MDIRPMILEAEESNLLLLRHGSFLGLFMVKQRVSQYNINNRIKGDLP